jgi:small subunit ribosomal protein S18
MARNPKATNKKKSHDRRSKPTAAGGGRPRRGRPKVCMFCREHATWVDYKEIDLLRRFINDRGRIKARGATGTCAQHQRDVATAVKTARELALLPYSVRIVGSESRGGRGGERRGGAMAAPTPEAPDTDASEPVAEDVVEPDEAEGSVSDGSADPSLPAPA